MAISYFTEQVAKPRLRYRLISQWLKNLISRHSLDVGSICYIFCNDEYLLDINKKYLNHDYYTDVISFNYNERNNIIGDIYISLERVSENASNFGVNLEEELLRVMVHGILHLLDYDDQSEEEKVIMRKLESEYISLYRKLEHDSSLKI